MTDPLKFRRKYEGIIKNYTNNVDQCAEQWLLSGEYEWLAGYYMYVQKIEELKDWIVKKESEMS
jgi:hypothetical protein|tara:strand:- start:163 stop:354 length:192 start_codon:yes stop_codon:yes gene_type:complete